MQISLRALILLLVLALLLAAGSTAAWGVHGAFAGVVAAVCLGGLAFALLHCIERPIRVIHQAVTSPHTEGGRVPIPLSGPTELVELARGINHLLDARATLQADLHTQHQALRDAKGQIHLAQQIARMGVWSWDLRTGMAHGDEILARMFGHTPEDMREISIKEWRRRTRPEDETRLTASVRACLKGETEQFEHHHRMLHKDGHWIWGQWRGRVTERDPNGRALKIVGAITDVTERMQERAQLQLAASVFTHAREGITITDPQGTIIDVNDTFTRITGYTRQEAIGNNPRMLQSGRQGPEFYAAMWQNLKAQGHWTGEIWNRRKSGELFIEVITISAVLNAQGEPMHYVSVFSDITAQKEYEQKLEHMAHYDALTGLPNRALLTDRLQQSILRCQRKGLSLAVVMVDLDGFKAVNDRYGHEIGDQLLITLAHRLKASLREADTFSRIGGDEFIATLVDLEHPQDYEPVLARLLQTAAAPVQIGEHLLQVSASIGVTLFPNDGSAPDLLIRHADQAMYLAKQAGKSRFHLFDVARDQAAQTHQAEVARIRQGLQAQEFTLYYQPKVNLRTGQVFAAEALIRWNHPERGLLAPAAFLPSIETHPIGIDVGEWVITTALRQMAAWKREGLHLPVSVNIDAQQLQKAGFSQRLAELLHEVPEVPPSWLELEILETSALEDIALVSDIMRQCQALGVRFALDDFGTGYSSLTYLKRLGAEEIKIDQSFVRDMLIDPDDMAIVQGVIGLARAFHRDVIAEGVESMEHCTHLLSLGCELAQGYGIARPMPAADIPGWTAQWQSAPRLRPLQKTAV